MSTTMDEQIKRWTALRKSALVMEILQEDSHFKRPFGVEGEVPNDHR